MSRSYWGYFPQSKPIPVENGIKAHTKRGKFGEHWWSKRWIKVLESFGNRKRLGRGRSYARKGQVMNIDLQPGSITAQVQGSRRTPYKVRISITPLNDGQWEHVIDALAAQAFYAAQLLGGEMPPEIEEVFEATGLSLLPTAHEVEMGCSCPDWATPCKHIAAVFYLLAESLDQDPFQTFVLRGRTRDQVMEALRQRRVAASSADEHFAPDEGAAPLEDAVDEFWMPQEDLDGFHIDIAPPEVDAAVLRRLGAPSFSERPEACRAALALAYASATDNALTFAFGEHETEESNQVRRSST